MNRQDTKNTKKEIEDGVKPKHKITPAKGWAEWLKFPIRFEFTMSLDEDTCAIALHAFEDCEDDKYYYEVSVLRAIEPTHFDILELSYNRQQILTRKWPEQEPGGLIIGQLQPEFNMYLTHVRGKVYPGVSPFHALALFGPPMAFGAWMILSGHLFAGPICFMTAMLPYLYVVFFVIRERQRLLNKFKRYMKAVENP